MAVAFARKHNIDYIECSALNALNIQLVFETIVRKVIREREKREGSGGETPEGTSSSRLEINRESVEEREKKKGQCC